MQNCPLTLESGLSESQYSWGIRSSAYYKRAGGGERQFDDDHDTTTAILKTRPSNEQQQAQYSAAGCMNIVMRADSRAKTTI